jgi:SPOR domain
MKQSKSTAAAFDLDDLERELMQAASPRKPASADDPLAELARIVGQEGGPVRPVAGDGRGSFDDFLSASPQPASGSMPTSAPLFPEPLNVEPAIEQAPRPVAAKPFDPLEALLAQDLGLRSGLDEMPEPAAQPVLKVPQALPSLDDLLAQEARAVASVAPIPAVEAAPAVTDHGSPAEQDSADVAADSVVHAPETVSPEIGHWQDVGAGGSSGTDDIHLEPLGMQTAGPSADAASDGKFDDMLAEFESAMREMAGGAVAPAAAPALAQSVAAPPPGAIVLPQLELPPLADSRPTVVGEAAVAGAAAAGIAAAGYAASSASIAPPAPFAPQPRQRRGLMLAGGAIAIAVVGLGALAMIGGGSSSRSNGSGPVPTIAAKPGVTKERPTNPGGVEVPNQDKEILQTRAATTQQAERVAPREEQPVDLNQARRQASEPQSPAAIRSIPGVAIVAPVTTTPPSGVAGPAPEPQPRPVASVPITIAGPGGATTPIAPPVSPVSPSSQFQTSLLPSSSAPAPAPPPSPVAAQPAPATVQPPSRSGAQQPAQPGAEPRRVRSVAIRPEAGEAAPSRAQPQPRVVPPAAAPAQEADAGVGPLRLTPQAARAAPAPARQAAVPPGTVPSSVPSLEEPAATPSSPAQTASTGSGFAVQLAAEGSAEAAQAKFNRMRGQYGAVLGGASPSIRSAEVNGRSVYRVRVGNMSREEASAMCERLKAGGGSCFVARN